MDECPICKCDFENPVTTLLGHAYCLNCIVDWFERGNKTDPVTGKQVLPLLSPAILICQKLNVPVTQVPEKFTKLQTQPPIIKLNNPPVQNGPRYYPNLEYLLEMERRNPNYFSSTKIINEKIINYDFIYNLF